MKALQTSIKIPQKETTFLIIQPLDRYNNILNTTRIENIKKKKKQKDKIISSYINNGSFEVDLKKEK